MPLVSQCGLQPAPRVGQVASCRGIARCLSWFPHGFQYEAATNCVTIASMKRSATSVVAQWSLIRASNKGRSARSSAARSSSARVCACVFPRRGRDGVSSAEFLACLHQLRTRDVSARHGPGLSNRDYSTQHNQSTARLATVFTMSCAVLSGLRPGGHRWRPSPPRPLQAQANPWQLCFWRAYLSCSCVEGGGRLGKSGAEAAIFS